MESILQSFENLRSTLVQGPFVPMPIQYSPSRVTCGARRREWLYWIQEVGRLSGTGILLSVWKWYLRALTNDVLATEDLTMKWLSDSYNNEATICVCQRKKHCLLYSWPLNLCLVPVLERLYHSNCWSYGRCFFCRGVQETKSRIAFR
jgi:hypothetical protein